MCRKTHRGAFGNAARAIEFNGLLIYYAAYTTCRRTFAALAKYNAYAARFLGPALDSLLQVTAWMDVNQTIHLVPASQLLRARQHTQPS